jgi:hypothetical protein
MTDSITRVVLEERAVENKPLGRHIEHDPRSRAYAFGVSIAPLVNVKHKRHGAIFNQLKLGSCTTNAACGAKNSDPLFKKGDKILHEKEAVDFTRSPHSWMVSRAATLRTTQDPQASQQLRPCTTRG